MVTKTMFFLLIMAALSTPDEPIEEPVSPLQSLVAAERAFSETSAKEGISKAFVEFLAEDAVMFRPGPVKARPLYVRNKNIPGTLTWKPELAEVARAGDLGYTTGPFEYTVETAGAKERELGHYISMWRKEPDGSWRVALDVGCPYEKPYSMKSEVFSPEPSPAPGGETGDAQAEDADKPQKDLLDRDELFSKAAASEGLSRAFESYAMKRIRLYRQGAHPHCGIEATLAAVEDAPPLTGSDAAAAEVSQSGDLGYTYGVFTCELSGAKDEGEARYSYLRIWRKDSGGNWKIVLAADTPHHKKP